MCSDLRHQLIRLGSYRADLRDNIRPILAQLEVLGSPSLIYHTTSLRTLKDIIWGKEIGSFERPFVSFSRKIQNDFGAVHLGFDPHKVDVQEVQYNPKWMARHPEIAEYVVGDDWDADAEPGTQSYLRELSEWASTFSSEEELVATNVVSLKGLRVIILDPSLRSKEEEVRNLLNMAKLDWVEVRTH